MTGTALGAGCFRSLFCSLMHGFGADDIRYGILRFEEKSYCRRLRLSFYSDCIAPAGHTCLGRSCYKAHASILTNNSIYKIRIACFDHVNFVRKCRSIQEGSYLVGKDSWAVVRS